MPVAKINGGRNEWVPGLEMAGKRVVTIPQARAISMVLEPGISFIFFILEFLVKNGKNTQVVGQAH